jgi:hypothetical protein
MESRSGKGSTRFVIQEAHETVALFGFDNHDWTGYAFSDHDSASYTCAQSPVEDQVSDEIEEEDDTDSDEDDEPYEDLFASNGTGQVLDANNAIWDPRNYFLCTAAFRVSIVVDRHSYLIQKLERGMKDWVRFISMIRGSDN